MPSVADPEHEDLTMKRTQLGAVVAIAVAIAAAQVVGCFQTKSEVDVKPVDINLNITGRLEVVVTDARKQEQQITGSAPKRTVRPEDIGLPAAPHSKSDYNGSRAMLSDEDSRLPGVMLVSEIVPVASEDEEEQQLIARMKARHPQVHSLLSQQLVGESHTGFLVPKATLSASQQSLVNADRAELYKLEAAEKSTTLDDAAMGFYMARLEHVDRGTWVERFNKSTGNWEWFQW